MPHLLSSLLDQITLSSLNNTDRSLRCPSPCILNQLSGSFRQLHHNQSLSDSPVTSLSMWQGATESAGPGQCRTWKMTDQIAGLENAGPGKCLGSKMPEFCSQKPTDFCR